MLLRECFYGFLHQFETFFTNGLQETDTVGFPGFPAWFLQQMKPIDFFFKLPYRFGGQVGGFLGGWGVRLQGLQSLANPN